MKHALLLLLLPACGGDVVFTLDAPTSQAELFPGETVDVDWNLAGGGGALRIDAVPIDGTDPIAIFDQDVPEGDGSFAWDGGGLPPDDYDLFFTLDDVEQDPMVDVMVAGVRFVDPAPGDTRAATGTYGIQLVTVTLRSLDLTTKLDDLVIDDRTIAGELVPHPRTISFDGTDTSGTPVPAGDYTVSVIASDPSSSATYTVTGGILSFTP